MPDSPNQPPPRVWLQWYGDGDPEIEVGSVNEGDVTWCRDQIFEGDIPYVPESEIARVRREGWNDCMQQVCAAAKKLDIGGLNRTRVYTMLQRLTRARDESEKQ